MNMNLVLNRMNYGTICQLSLPLKAVDEIVIRTMQFFFTLNRLLVKLSLYFPNMLPEG